jgi:hypothetical protein
MDVINANFTLMNCDTGFGEVYNFANGTSVRILKIANLTIETSYSFSKILFEIGRLGDIKQSLADITKFWSMRILNLRWILILIFQKR